MAVATSRCWYRRSFWGLLLLLCQPVGLASAQTASSETASSETASPETASPETALPEAAPSETAPSETLQFTFSGTPWREVLNWLADGADLALHVSELPTGSFTYSDPHEFTPNEAIERLNLFLIPQGYTLVRRGSLLSVISLSDPRSMQQLDAMAELVSPDDLSDRGNYDVVKCIIPLGEIVPQDATAELSSLTLMSEPVVLPNSNQLMVTDTVGKIKTVVSILRSLEKPSADGEVVRRFHLRYTDLENLLLVGGPHLGIEGDQLMGIDISISADETGKQLFVSGTDEKMKLLESLIEMLDVPSEAAASDDEVVLRSHVVDGENLQTVYDVLQTLLAGKSMRLSMEPKTNSIVAWADPNVHEEITQTIQELQAPAIDFAVVELNELDPYFAITLLSEMFDIPSAYDDEEESGGANAPKIDADPENMRLFVRGSGSQIAQIKQVVESLDESGRKGSETRVIPLPGERAQQVLDIAEKFWQGENPLLVLPPAGNVQAESFERAIHPDAPDPQSPNPVTPRDQHFDTAPALPQSTSTAPPSLASRLTNASSGDESPSSLEAESATSARPPIRSQLVPQGIVIQSDDVEALDRFEEQLRLLAGPRKTVMAQPVVFYLKYSNAEEAVRMLADLLDAAGSMAGPSTGSLVRGGSSAPLDTGFYGSLLLDRDGATTVTAGSATIISDARLNRLFVQGTADDIEVVERYLKIIDKGASITTIETYGSSHVIDLIHAQAADVAEVVREAYAGRIANNNQPGGQSQQRQGDRGRDDSSQNRGSDSRQRGEEQRTPEKKARGREPEMTLAVHEASNSLVITAPDQLFAEVEQLVQSVDVRAEQTVEVIAATDGGHLESVLMSMLGEETTDNNRSESRSSSQRSSRERSSRENRSSSRSR